MTETKRSAINWMDVLWLVFLAGLALYERRPDKQYSLADCISMNVMRQRGIQEVLTNDQHFKQEGFKRLLERT